MVPGFHCSSLEFHDPATLIAELAARGFDVVALRPRRGGWDDAKPWFESVSAEIASAAKEHGVSMVVDLDASFYDHSDQMDSLALASDNAQQRNAALMRLEQWIQRAALIRPMAITFSTGRAEDAERFGAGELGGTKQETKQRLGTTNEVGPLQDTHGENTLERLAESIDSLSETASEADVELAIRPRSGHAISSVAHFERFEQWLPPDTRVGLAADVGEMLLGGEFPIGTRLSRLKHRLTCVYLCEPDLERGEDQRFGHGDIDLGRVWSVMTENGVSIPGIFRACGHSRQGLKLMDEAMAIVAQQ